VICDAARLLIGGDPQTVPVELDEHLQRCSDCPQFRERMLELDVRLQRAFAAGPANSLRLQPLELSGTIASSGRPSRPSKSAVPPLIRSRTWSTGIGLAAALLMGVALWLGQPPPSLAAEVIAHIENEPGSWSATKPVSAALLASVLEAGGIKLRAPLGLAVVYARNCSFQGHSVPHFVVNTESGPITVIVLAQVQVHSPVRFQADEYRGLLLPFDGGGVAVVSHTDLSLDGPGNQVVYALSAGLDRNDDLRMSSFRRHR
jgi:hypothetical protein